MSTRSWALLALAGVALILGAIILTMLDTAPLPTPQQQQQTDQWWACTNALVVDAPTPNPCLGETP